MVAPREDLEIVKSPQRRRGGPERAGHVCPAWGGTVGSASPALLWECCTGVIPQRPLVVIKVS